ncbi:hypothetical protein SAMN06265348_12143 [Pedobacter westerhofensis]|uniref:Uncharacterized protein n=1 Tax=Pedobacter westerhofensis TaxID=425512 RepID=A0A521FSR8_9SPHI|nr:hypothetical protein [Pedobacter westerhofensis]SMO99275.1 hypothetical protein SAMN06265348_12143 [Pedobacter westerhofensis]
MAKLIGNLLSGSLGPYVFRIVNGKQIVSRKEAPGTRKQTLATKAASRLFGDAANLGTQVRKTLAAQYPDLFDRIASNKISGHLFKALSTCKYPQTGHFEFGEDSFALMERLEFNPGSPVSSMMAKIPHVGLMKNYLVVFLSELVIPREFKFPKKSIRCEIVVAVSLFRLREGLMVELAEHQSIVIEKDQVIVKPYEFKFEVPAGCLCLVTVFLNYSTVNKNGWLLIKDNDFSPGCICGAIVTPGKYQGNDQRIWKKMIKFI